MGDKMSLDSVLAQYPKRAVEQRICWYADTWRRGLADVDEGLRVREVLDALAAANEEHGGLLRSDVIGAADDDAVHLLVAAMAWGFGPTGYGASRTATMLGTPSLREHLVAMRAESRTGTPNDAFQSLFTNRRANVRQLGIAMGTKYLYFSGLTSSTDGPRPLVYDINVYKGLCSLSDGPENPPHPGRFTRGADYQCVVEWIHQRAAERGLAPDDVEVALFEHGKQS